MHYLVSYETEKLYSFPIFLKIKSLFEKPILLVEKDVTFSCYRYYQIWKIRRIYFIHFTEKDFIQKWTNKACHELRIMIGFSFKILFSKILLQIVS